jgi:hypothetical protein
LPGGLNAGTIARLTLRHGSPKAAAEKAKQDPRFAQEFRELERLQWMGIVSGPWETAEDRNAAATAEWWKLVVAWDLLDANEPEQQQAAGLKRRTREPDPLDDAAVQRCEAKLRERDALRRRGEHVPHELTFEGIGEPLEWNRERVRHANKLLKLGWPLQKRHPEVSAKDGIVQLPSVEKAASALGLSDAEAEARLAETFLPLT